MTAVQLSHQDARLVYLAIQYHLGRPGSELDPDTKQPAARGLAQVAQALEPQLAQAVAQVEVDEQQQRRLVSAVAGAGNELKTYPLLDALPGGGRRTAVPGFDAVLRRLYPEVDEDPEFATQLAGHLLALRRRLEAIAPVVDGASVEASGRRSWWRFWGRGGG